MAWPCGDTLEKSISPPLISYSTRALRTYGSKSPECLLMLMILTQKLVISNLFCVGKPACSHILLYVSEVSAEPRVPEDTVGRDQICLLFLEVGKAIPVLIQTYGPRLGTPRSHLYLVGGLVKESGPMRSHGFFPCRLAGAVEKKH